MERSLICGILVGRPSSRATQSPMQVGNMIRVVDELGSTTKRQGFRNSTDHAINRVLVMNIMQVRSAAFSLLVYQKNLVVRVEMDNAVLGVETRGKTRANMIANHNRITHMQVSHWSERWFGAACAGHADVQGGKGPCMLQGFQGDVTCIGTEMTSLDTKQFVKGVIGSHPRSKKKGLSNEFWLGMKLYAATALGRISSRSSGQFWSLFQVQSFRK